MKAQKKRAQTHCDAQGFDHYSHAYPYGVSLQKKFYHFLMTVLGDDTNRCVPTHSRLVLLLEAIAV